jgi:hypothetical protein
MRMVLRFHSFGLDSKSEIVHCIQQELIMALGEDREDVKYFEVIPRIAFIETVHAEVMDVVITNEVYVNIAKIYVHFTGNADGGIRQVEFGGIDATVMAGSNIIELGYHKHAPQRIYWAAMHELELTDTRYIVHLLIAGGNKISDMISVVFAKPKHIVTRKSITTTAERKVNTHRALTDEKCTVIFASNQALRKFVSNFKVIEYKCQNALATLKKGRQEMSEEEFRYILNEICVDMNLQAG